MKESKSKIFLIVGLIVIASLVLTGCTGGAMATNNWPGVSADGESVYLANTTLTSLRMADGTVKWQYPEKADAKHLLYSQPVVLEDQVLVGDYGGVLRSINPKTGTLLWTFEDADNRYIASPVVTEDQIFASSMDGTLYALNLNGALQWKFETKSGLWVSPVANGDMVYQSSMDKKLYALKQSDGTLVWEADMGAASVTMPVLAEDASMLYVNTFSNKVIAVNTATGSILWETPTSDTVWSQPFLVDGNLYFGDNAGNVYSLDADNGSVNWTIPLTGAVIAGGVKMADGLVFASENGEVVMLDADGAKIWTRTITGELYSNLVVVEDRLLVPVMKGDQTLVCYDNNGNQVWIYTPSK